MNFILASHYAYFVRARWSSYTVKFFVPKAWLVQGLTPLKSETLFIFPKMSRPPLGPNQDSYSLDIQDSFTDSTSTHGVKFITHLHLVPR
jgi:hypothetical protein